MKDFSRLHRSDGAIVYRLYQQNGTMQEMRCADIYDNRLLIDWVQAHDRYTEKQNGKL